MNPYSTCKFIPMKWWLRPNTTQKLLTRTLKHKPNQVFGTHEMSRPMGKPTICIGENKGADQFAVTAKLISAFVFATRTVQFLFYLNPKFQASSLLLCLYRPVCVGPVRKPHCWFSHEVAQIVISEHISKLLVSYFEYGWFTEA